MNLKIYILLSVVFYSPIVLSTPSFNCGSNLNLVEQKICNNDELSKIDNTMVRIYKSVFQTTYITEENKEKIKISQRKWRSGRNLCAKSSDIKVCIKDKYITRIKTLRTSISNTPSHRLYVEGNKFYENKDNFNSLKKYKESYEKADNISDKVQSLGALYFVDKDNSSGYLKTILKIDPKNDFALGLLGRNKSSIKTNKEKNKQTENFHKVSTKKIKTYDFKGEIKHYHRKSKGGKTLHSHIFPPSKWNHAHTNFLKAQPFQTEKEKDLSMLNYNSWESLHKFLLKYGHLETDPVKKAYKSLFSLREKESFKRSDKDFEADYLNYKKDFSKFIKINIIKQTSENSRTINTLKNTPINLNVTTSDMKLKLSASRVENTPLIIKNNHDILVLATLVVRIETSMFGWFSAGEEVEEYSHKVKISLNKGSNNPQDIVFGRMTTARGFPLFEDTLKMKTKIRYSIKIKILGVD
jgi:uncharacterized protein